MSVTTTAPLAPWLFRQLVEQAVIDEDGVNDKPKPRRCRSCGAATLVAWQDGKLDAVVVDPIDLTPLGELQAVCAGRRTFAHWGGPSGQLDLREARQIARWPAGNRAQAVRPEHRCGAPIPDHIPTSARADHDQPPF